MKNLAPFFDAPGGAVVELGSRDGHDAREIADIFSASRVITIEANPDSFEYIQNTYPQFENYNVAISNQSGILPFYRVRSEYDDTIRGQSSLLYKSSYDEIADKIEVPALTMDKFVSDVDLKEIEVLKIDVEGATFEVLEGFSNIRITRLLHIESEHEQFWEGQKLYEDTAEFMMSAGYKQVYFAPVWTNQSDSIWLRKD